MKLFKFEGYKVTISEEAFALKAFKAIWDRDTTETKDKALQELAFIYFMLDPRSDYQYIIDDDERAEIIKEDEGISKRWKPDKVVKEAMKLYSRFKPMAALLLEDTRCAIDKVRKVLRDLDLSETDDRGKPIYTIDKVLAAVKLVPPLVKELDEAERALSNEMKNNGRMRGTGEKTLMEDGLNI